MNIALSVVYFFILLLCYWVAGTINLFSMHVYITVYLCFAPKTSTFVANECCCTGITFIGIYRAFLCFNCLRGYCWAACLFVFEQGSLLSTVGLNKETKVGKLHIRNFL